MQWAYGHIQKKYPAMPNFTADFGHGRIFFLYMPNLNFDSACNHLNLIKIGHGRRIFLYMPNPDFIFSGASFPVMLPLFAFHPSPALPLPFLPVSGSIQTAALHRLQPEWK